MEKYKDFIKRFKKLSGIEDKPKTYLIKITIHKILIAETLNEYQVYQNFEKSKNRYTYHPETTNPPVKAHYHVYPSNSKKELYALNVDDGKAHHKKNRGHLVSKKEAEELQNLGVKLPKNNILESKQIKDIPALFNLNENDFNIDSYYFIINLD